MEKLSYELMKKVVESENVCAECGAPLTQAWSAEKNDYILRCGRDIKHTGIRRDSIPNLSELFGFNLFDVNKKRRMEREMENPNAIALRKYEAIAVMTKSAATEIIETLWKEAPPVEKAKAIMICHQYQYNPLMNHVHMVKYNRKDRQGNVIGADWSIIIGIGATRLNARRRHNYSYMDLTPRAMTTEEGKKALGEEYRPEQYVYSITIIRDLDSGAEAYGVGIWPRNSEPKGTDKGNSKQHMANIHSERQALDRLYPGEMPSGVEVEDERYIGGEAQREVPHGSKHLPDEDITEAEYTEDGEHVHQEVNISGIEALMIDANYTLATLVSYLNNVLKVSPEIDGGTLPEIWARISPEQQEKACKHLEAKAVR